MYNVQQYYYNRHHRFRFLLSSIDPEVRQRIRRRSRQHTTDAAVVALQPEIGF